MKNTPFIAVTSQPVPYHADTTAIFNTLCQQNSNSLLLDSAEIGSKNSLQSLILINAAVKITCLGNQVTFRALNANGKQVLKEIHPVLSQLGTVSAVNFDNVLTNIESLAKDDNYGYRKADPYWARVLGQTEQFKSQDGLLQLVKETTSWFGEMLS